MARIKLAYIGGGSTRAPGTVASFLQHGESFQGSEIVLIDLDQEKLDLVKALATKMAQCWGADIRISASTERRAALEDCDAVLSSFRPGGFEARYLDESIPLKHGIIGQETQGPGGFFMALRAIHVTQNIIVDIEQVCPKAILFNYTNPVNIVAEAVSHHSSIPIISLCEGPIFFARSVVRAAGLDPNRLDAQMIGLNHGCWTNRHLYDGQDVMPLLEVAYEGKRQDPQTNPQSLRLLWLAVRMQSIPADYFKYYYFKDEVLQELLSKPTTRAQDIMAQVPDYWAHYREQANSDNPQLDPAQSRGGIYELELAFNVMDAVFNDLKEIWTVNIPNQAAIADFPSDLVVEVPCYIDRHGASPIAQGHMPRQVIGLLHMLAEYQALTAEAAWTGTRADAIRALACNPLVMSLSKSEAVYNEMAVALRDYLPERLW